MIFNSKTLSLILISGTFAPAALAAEAAHAEPWYMNTTNWAMLVLVLFLAFVWKAGAFKTIAKMLDGRADEIQRELDHATGLREEALEMLKEAERKQQEATDLAASIISQAEADAKALMVQADKDLADMVARREAQVEARIARAEEEATQAVKKVAADAATKAAGNLLKAQADKNGGAEAFSTAVSQAKAAI